MSKSRARVVFVEGLCGSGKSTLGARLGDSLSGRGIPAVFYDEGAYPHPVSLNWHAALSTSDFEALCARYADLADELGRRAIVEGAHVLIAYRDFEGHPIFDALRAKELCWTNTPAVSRAEFCALLESAWRRLAGRMMADSPVVILDGVFLQHPIHDLVRNYGADDRAIVAHVWRTAEILLPAKPALLYLDQQNPRRQMEWIAGVRQRAHYARDESIRQMERRRAVELEIVRELPFPARVIEIPHRDWDQALDAMVKFLI